MMNDVGLIDPAGLLSPDEMDRLAVNFVQSRREIGFGVEELEAVIEWARFTRLQSALLDLALSGQVDIDWNGREVMFAPRRGEL